MSQDVASRKFFKTREIVEVALFTAILAVCSWISVPTTIPFTLQTFGIFCAMLILGGKKGFFSILTYILLGAVGVPVFSGFKAGISALTSYSGGYIWGFIFLGAIFWCAEKFIGNKFYIRIISLIVGLMVCYTCGTLWFMYIMKTSFIYGLSVCVVPYLAFDGLKLLLAILISSRVRKYLPTSAK